MGSAATASRRRRGAWIGGAPAAYVATGKRRGGGSGGVHAVEEVGPRFAVGVVS